MMAGYTIGYDSSLLAGLMPGGNDASGNPLFTQPTGQMAESDQLAKEHLRRTYRTRTEQGTGRKIAGEELYAVNPLFKTADSITAQLQEQGKLYGVDYGNKSGNNDEVIRGLAYELASAGVSDLKSLRKQGNKLVDTKTGKVIKETDNFAKAFASPDGKGWTDYGVQFDSKGRPVFTQAWQSSSDAPKIAALAGLALNFFAPGSGAALGNALGLTGTTASVVGNGLVQAGLSAAGGARGSNILRSGLAGGVAPVLSTIPGFSSLPGLVKGATSGAVASAIKGQNPLAGALTGAIPGNITGNSAADAMLRAIVGTKIKQSLNTPPRKP